MQIFSFLETIRKRGALPLIELLDIFGGWPVLNPDWNEEEFDIIQLMAKLRLYNNDILVSEWIGPDIKNSDEYIIQVLFFYIRKLFFIEYCFTLI